VLSLSLSHNTQITRKKEEEKAGRTAGLGFDLKKMHACPLLSCDLRTIQYKFFGIIDKYAVS
jgi:hypothetical protein